jgi:hypothetical protein
MIDNKAWMDYINGPRQVIIMNGIKDSNILRVVPQISISRNFTLYHINQNAEDSL